MLGLTTALVRLQQFDLKWGGGADRCLWLQQFDLKWGGGAERCLFLFLLNLSLFIHIFAKCKVALIHLPGPGYSPHTSPSLNPCTYTHICTHICTPEPPPPPPPFTPALTSSSCSLSTILQSLSSVFAVNSGVFFISPQKNMLWVRKVFVWIPHPF